MFNRLTTLKFMVNLRQVFIVRVAAENGQWNQLCLQQIKMPTTDLIIII